MFGSLAHIFNGLQKRSKNVEEAEPIYIDDLNLKKTQKAKKTTTKPRKVVRFQDEATKKTPNEKDGFRDEAITNPQLGKEGLGEEKVIRHDLDVTLQTTRTATKPRKVVRFQDEVTVKPLNEKEGFMHEPTLKPLKEKEGFGNEPEKKPLDETEGSGEEAKEVIRVKVKMTKREAERLLSGCRNGGVLDFRHVAEQIVNMPVHRVDVSTVKVACNDKNDKGRSTVLGSIPEEF